MQVGEARQSRGFLRGLAFAGVLYVFLLIVYVTVLPILWRPSWVRRIVFGAGRIMTRWSLRAGGVRVTFTGRERLAAVPAPYVIVANHASNLDPLAMFIALGRTDLGFVAKAHTMRRKLLGRLLHIVGWIGVDRESLASLKKLREDVAARVARGDRSPIVIFPEGTRSPDGRLQPFKLGPFLLAAQCGLPIVPIVIRGTFARHRKSEFSVHAGPVTVEICAAVAAPPDGLSQLAVVDAAAALQKQVEAIYKAIPDLTVVDEPARAAASARSAA